ncbi:65-kDa microtubule-associated protein 6 isoform X1 [Nymphaea colorata]|nr:65-kDa microtubule-associated protein 6 isoform X1 [Nymphaea colorata]
MISARMDSSCGVLLRELQHIWDEIGESESEKDRMLMEIERECLEVYRRKVAESNHAKARLHQSLAAKEAELAALVAAIGDINPHSLPERRPSTLKEQLGLVTPLLEGLRAKKEERVKQFADIKGQIEKISKEINGYAEPNDSITSPDAVEEHDLSLRKLNEYHIHLQSLQKEKSDRLHKVLEYVNEVHGLCASLGLDFGKMVSQVHPSLHETGNTQCKNISNDTLVGLSQSIEKLKMEKKARIQKLKDIVPSLLELWNLLDTPNEEKKLFDMITGILGSSESDIKDPGILSNETIQQATEEVERLSKLKASKMKELVLKRRSELEDICQKAHLDPDMSTAPEKSIALIDSGILDPSELLSNIESQIVKAKADALSRKDIMDRVDKWRAACEEEKWLEEYNQDDNKYNAGRGAHKNLKRAEKARIIITKISAMVDNLMNRALAWEEEKKMHFLYDGVRLTSLLEDYVLARQQKEEERRRYRDHKKLQDLLLTEREAIYGSKPSPKRSSSLKKPNGIRSNGSATPTPRRLSLGSATPELLTPRSYSGRQNGFFRDTHRMSLSKLNFVALTKEDAMSVASMCPETVSPPSTCS